MESARIAYTSVMGTEKIANDGWLTIHYPHLPNSKTRWNIYLKKQRPAERLPRVGDLIIFYETYRRAQRVGAQGRKAIVRYAVVSGTLRPATTADAPWHWEIDCIDDKPCTPISFYAIRRIIPTFRRPTGLRKLKPQDIEKLKSAAGIP